MAKLTLPEFLFWVEFTLFGRGINWTEQTGNWQRQTPPPPSPPADNIPIHVMGWIMGGSPPTIWDQGQETWCAVMEIRNFKPISLTFLILHFLERGHKKTPKNYNRQNFTKAWQCQCQAWMAGQKNIAVLYFSFCAIWLGIGQLTSRTVTSTWEFIYLLTFCVLNGISSWI